MLRMQTEEGTQVRPVLRARAAQQPGSVCRLREVRNSNFDFHSF